MITHPEKVLFPDDGITKGELAAYYASVASVIVPHLRNRPLTMERFPAGLGKPGFLQKNVVKAVPKWLKRVTAAKKDGTVHYALINDARALEWMANQNTITPHVWTSRAPKLMYPDVCVFDLDPARDDAEELRSAALAVRDALGRAGLRSWVKTSGSKGFHIVVPLDRSLRFGEVHRFTDSLARELIAQAPDRFTQEFHKVDRAGRILLDTGRNAYGATFAAPYAVRARPGAPVSAPCTWEEIERREAAPRTFTLRTMAARLAAAGDLWSDLRPD